MGPFLLKDNLKNNKTQVSLKWEHRILTVNKNRLALG